MIIPFGKHKGTTVAEVLATDPQYAEWVLGQAWFAERFAELHAALLSRGAASDDTPEHNAIQARFLDPLFRAAFVLCVKGPEALQQREKARQNELEIRQTRLHEYERVLVERRGRVEYYRRSGVTMAGRDLLGEAETKLREIEQTLANSRKHAEATPVVVAFGSSPVFERRGVDVALWWWFTVAEREQRQPGSARSFEDPLGIEIKPSLGDDFPAVMRQMERLDGPVTRSGAELGRWVRYLVIDRFSGSLPLDTVREMFRANERRLVTVREIEAEIANARALVSS